MLTGRPTITPASLYTDDALSPLLSPSAAASMSPTLGAAAAAAWPPGPPPPAPRSPGSPKSPASEASAPSSTLHYPYLNPDIAATDRELSPERKDRDDDKVEEEKLERDLQYLRLGLDAVAINTKFKSKKIPYNPQTAINKEIEEKIRRHDASIYGEALQEELLDHLTNLKYVVRSRLDRQQTITKEKRAAVLAKIRSINKAAADEVEAKERANQQDSAELAVPVPAHRLSSDSAVRKLSDSKDGGDETARKAKEKELKVDLEYLANRLGGEGLIYLRYYDKRLIPSNPATHPETKAERDEHEASLLEEARHKALLDHLIKLERMVRDSLNKQKAISKEKLAILIATIRNINPDIANEIEAKERAKEEKENAAKHAKSNKSAFIKGGGALGIVGIGYGLWTLPPVDPAAAAEAGKGILEFLVAHSPQILHVIAATGVCLLIGLALAGLYVWDRSHLSLSSTSSVASDDDIGASSRRTTSAAP